MELHVLSPAAVFLSPTHLLLTFKCTPLYFAITNYKWNASNRFTKRGKSRMRPRTNYTHKTIETKIVKYHFVLSPQYKHCATSFSPVSILIFSLRDVIPHYHTEHNHDRLARRQTLPAVRTGSQSQVRLGCFLCDAEHKQGNQDLSLSTSVHATSHLHLVLFRMK